VAAVRRLLLIALLVAAGCGATVVGGRDDTQGGEAGRTFEGRVARVVDGDTIHVDLGDRREKVRYIGVDTPESVKPNTPVQCYAKAASAANARLVSGRRVRLELDVEDRDRYGRLLAYVYAGKVFVNAELVRRGFAVPLTIPPNVRHAGRFRALAREAREAGRGLWAACER
jgi:micrococcal nuclease